jgi:hypothetical protein
MVAFGTSKKLPYLTFPLLEWRIAMNDDPHIQQLQDWSQVNEPEPCERELAELDAAITEAEKLTGHEATLYRVRQLHAQMIRDMLNEGKP